MQPHRGPPERAGHHRRHDRRPGARAAGRGAGSRLPTATSLTLPIVVSTAAAGRRLWLSAVVHGDELNGLEIIRRVLEAVRPRQLAGTLLAVPIVNVFGLLSETRYLPDRRDLNRSFPGSPKGSLGRQLAHLFMTNVVAACDMGIDLHTGSDHRYNLPQIRGDLEDPATRGPWRRRSARRSASTHRCGTDRCARRAGGGASRSWCTRAARPTASTTT